MSDRLASINFAQAPQVLATVRALNPTDVDDSLAVLGYLLDGMNAHPPEPVDHLNVLEEIRPTLDFVMGQASQRYVARPLPRGVSQMRTAVLQSHLGPHRLPVDRLRLFAKALPRQRRGVAALARVDEMGERQVQR